MDRTEARGSRSHLPNDSPPHETFRAALVRRTRLWRSWMQERNLGHRALWMAKFSFLGCLPAAVLVNAHTTAPYFTPPVLTISFLVVTTAGTFGRGFASFVVGMKVLCVGLCLTSAALGANVASITGLWWVTLVVGVFLIALLTEFITTMNTMLLFLIGMMHHYLDFYGGRTRSTYSLLQSRDVIVGVLLGLVSSLFPFRCDEYAISLHSVKALASQTFVLLQRSVDAFYCPSNAHRTVQLMNIRALVVRWRETQRAAVESCLYAWNEPLHGLLVAQLESRLRLLDRVSHRLTAVVAICEDVCLSAANVSRRSPGEDPLSTLFEPPPTPVLDVVQVALSTLGDFILALNSRRITAGDAEGLVRAKATLSASFASRVPALQGGKLSDAAAQQSSPTVFSNATVVEGALYFQLIAILEDFAAFLEPDIWSTQKRLAEFMKWPLRELSDVRQLVLDVRHWTGRGPAKVLYSLKLTVSITLFCAFLLVKGVGDPFFGPAQMAFASGVDSSVAVSVFGAQIAGCVLGTVFGFLASAATGNGEDTVALVSIIVVGALVTSFLRSSRQFGLAAIYTQFAFFGAARPFIDATVALTSILTNSVAMTVFVLVQLAVLPSNPWGQLQAEMCKTLESLKLALRHSHKILLLGNRSFDGQVPSFYEEMFFSCAASIEAQRQLVRSAAQQPRLTTQRVPEELLDRIIQKELDIVELIYPGALAWKQLVDAGFEVQAQSLSSSIADVAQLGESVLTHLTSIVLVAPSAGCSSDELDSFAQSVADACGNMREAVDSLLVEYTTLFRAEYRIIGEPLQLMAHQINSVVYSCAVLPAQLLDLLRLVLDLKHSTTNL